MDRTKIAGQFSLAKSTATSLLASSIAGVMNLVKRYKNFALAFAMTAIFYLPALKHGSIDAGFLYTGDVLGFCLPILAKMHALISSFNFTAIDFSMFNGSSDFFVAANIYGYHPLIVLYSLLTPAATTTLQQTGQALVVMLALHTFIACFFSLKLFTRFFAFEFGAAALIATTFAFSTYMVITQVEPMFWFCVSVLPWAAYSALSYSDRPAFRKLVLACLPMIFSFMGGYIPLALASLALSFVLVATKIVLLDDDSAPLEDRLRRLFSALLPYVCATLIASLYLYSVYRFTQDSPSARTPSLFYSAHQLAELPQSVIRLLSTNFQVPGPAYQYSVQWGLIAFAIVALFFLSRNALDKLTPRDWTLIKVSATIYALTVLSIFGEYSVVSDLVYYLVPQVGTMHIYQRFLVPTNIFFAILITLMLKALIRARPLNTIRPALIIFAIATFMTAYVVGYYPHLAHKMGINNSIVVELMLALLFVSALAVPSKPFIYGVVIALSCLPALNHMYDYTHGANTLDEQRKRHVVELNDAVKSRLVSYFKRLSHKAIIKYVDITPRWASDGVETFPKSFPYFVLNELQLSSYTGFNFYLSVRSDYMRTMPVEGQSSTLHPDWEIAANTGADFIVARESDVQKSGFLSALLAKVKQEDRFKLPHGVIVFPLAQKSRSTPSVFDNGYFRVYPTDSRQQKTNFALKTPATLSSTFGSGEARLAVDGNTDGDYAHGSVAHSRQDRNAWLDIDLGASKTIDSVVVWNRTDCCAERIRGFWVFISETPFLPSDTVATLRTRAGTWGEPGHFPAPKSTILTGGVKGRYVRVQLDGTESAEGSFLQVAELQAFGPAKPAAGKPHADSASDLTVKKFVTNHANYLRLDVQSSKPATVQYLFANNPRLHYYLNGQPATVIDRDGLRTIDVPAGNNSIEIRYKQWPLRIFWIVYTLYWIAFLWAIMATILQTSIWRKLFGSR